jgi:hypothetical protein
VSAPSTSTPGATLTGTCPPAATGTTLDLLWTRCSAATSGDCIGAGGTSTDYTVQTADVGYKLRLFDRLCDSSGCSSWVASTATSVVQRP